MLDRHWFQRDALFNPRLTNSSTDVPLRSFPPLIIFYNSVQLEPLYVRFRSNFVLCRENVLFLPQLLQHNLLLLGLLFRGLVKRQNCRLLTRFWVLENLLHYYIFLDKLYGVHRLRCIYVLRFDGLL